MRKIRNQNIIKLYKDLSKDDYGNRKEQKKNQQLQNNFLKDVKFVVDKG